MSEKRHNCPDVTPYTFGTTILDVIFLLRACSKIPFKWFDDNYMKANSDKSHILLSAESDVYVAFSISELTHPYSDIISLLDAQ